MEKMEVYIENGHIALDCGWVIGEDWLHTGWKMERLHMWTKDSERENTMIDKKEFSQAKGFFIENGKADEYNIFLEITEKIKTELKELICTIDPQGKCFLELFQSGGVKGKNDLRNLFWWNIKINTEFVKDKYVGYTNILFTPYRITLSDNNLVNIGNGTPFPQIDTNTGNIHVFFDIFKWIEEYRNGMQGISQVVLVGPALDGGKDPGPKWGVFNKQGQFSNDEMNIYADKNKTIYVPKGCYYPRVLDETVHCEDVYGLLKGLLDEIMEESKIKELAL